MGRIDKLLAIVLSGQRDKSMKFNDIRHLMTRLGFGERIKGDHFIYTKDNVDEIINIQPFGAFAKPYQVKQLRSIILKYKLGVDDNV